MSIKQDRINKMNEKASIEEQILRLQNEIDNCLLQQGKFFADKMMEQAKSSLVIYGTATGYEVCLYPEDLKEFGVWNKILDIDRLREGAHRAGTVYLTTMPRMFDNPYFKVDSDLIFKLVEKAMLDNEIHIKQKMVDMCGRVESRFEMKVMM